MRFARARSSAFALALGLGLALGLATVLAGPGTGRALARPIEVDPAVAPSPGEMLLRFEPGTSPGHIAFLQREARARHIRTIPSIEVHLLAVDDLDRALALYRADDALRWAEPNGEVHLMGAEALDAKPNDPRYPEQWHHETIGSEAGWAHARAHETVIAIIDTGVQCDHPDLEGACVAGYDFVNRDDDPADDHHHGTIEAGMAAAVTDNGVGVAGLAWGARIMPLKAMPGQGGGSFADIAEAIVWAADHGADVANMSLGASSSSKAIEDAVAHGAASGMVMVASAGNHGTGAPSYPAGLPEVIGVGATKPDDTRASFSAYGDHVAVAAPGWQVLSTDWTEEYEEYGTYDGTSEAAPLVAALAALLIDQEPSRSPAWVRHRIEDTAVDVGIAGRDPEFGWGRIDAARALDPDDPGNGLVPTPDEPVAPTFTPAPTSTPSPTEAPAPAYLPQLRSGR